MLRPDTILGGRLQTCRRLIDDGSIGDVTAASAFVVSHGHEWFHPNPDFFYKPGAGTLTTSAPTMWLRWCLCSVPPRRCAAMSKRTFDKRIIESEPNKGKVIDVKVDTHVSGSIEFVNGALATLIASFDVWDSELPRLEIYGTKGTICIRDIDPVDESQSVRRHGSRSRYRQLSLERIAASSALLGLARNSGCAPVQRPEPSQEQPRNRTCRHGLRSYRRPRGARERSHGSTLP